MSDSAAGIATGSPGAVMLSQGAYTVVHTFAKNTQERVQAALTTYRGKRYADLRVYYEADGGEWRPTEKGVTIALNLLPELEVAVRALRKKAAA